VSFSGQFTETALAEITRNLGLDERVLRVMLTRLPDLAKKAGKVKKAKEEVVSGSAGDAGATS
ncbi:MAG: hypothetical protein ACPL7D_13010, partial [Candidatus Sumerlaeaceae bacterium]